MKNRKILLIIGILLFFSGMFILFKAAVYGVYKSSLSDIDNLENIIEEYRNSEEVTITSKNADEYMELDGFRIGNYFSQFKYDDEASVGDFDVYYQYNGDDKSGMLSIGTFVQLIDAAGDDEVSFYGLSVEEEGISFSGLLYSGFEDYIKRNNIKNDADLIKSWSKYDFNNKLGVFTSLKRLREDFSIRTIASVVLPEIDKIYYLNGDLDGYILEIQSNNGRKVYDINVFKGDKRYIVSIISNDYLLEDVIEIVSTIEIY